jgi:hypothetical protein
LYSASLGGFVLITVLMHIVQWAAPQFLRFLRFVFLALGFLWITASFITGFRAQRFRCPQCGKPFFVGRWAVNNWARRCVHCGLPKWSEPPATMNSSAGSSAILI